MGRFATTASSSMKHLRPPYPPEFFRSGRGDADAAKRHALIDLGTGPGLLALGFAPYVGRVVGVDPEPLMIAAAREAAARAGQDFALIEGKAEDLPEDIGRFDSSRSDARCTGWSAERRWRCSNGWSPMTARSSSARRSPPPTDAIRGSTPTTRRGTLVGQGPRPAGGRARALHRDLAAFCWTARGFRVASQIRVETSHMMTIADLARRVLTFSSSSPAVLGDKVDAMLADVEARLAAVQPQDGRITEVVVSTAQVVRR